MPEAPYHHGDLRRAVLDSALELIAEAGPAAVSLRALARRLGVSHAAPTHHFKTKEGVFTAIAGEGFAIFADALAGVSPTSMADLGAAYVRFALEHRAHFAVMFRQDLYDAEDPFVVTSRERAWAALADGAEGAQIPSGTTVEVAQLGAWALVHGFATLFTTGMVQRSDAEVDDLVRQAAALMFRS